MSGIKSEPGKAVHGWLYVRGELDADGGSPSLRVEALTSTDDLTDPAPGQGYVLASLGAGGHVLASVSFDPPAGHDRGRSGGACSAYLPWNIKAVAIELTRGGERLLRVEAAAEPPHLVLRESPAAGEAVSGLRTISWKGAAASAVPSYSLWFSGDRGITWRPLSLGIFDRSVAVDFDLLPRSSAAMLRVTATAGLRTVTVESAVFVVAPAPPVVEIVAPLAGAVVAPGVPFSLHARAVMGGDAEVEAWSWSSDRDGALSADARRWAALLTPGRHTLTAALKSAAGHASASTTILVEKRADEVIPVAVPDAIAGIRDALTAATMFVMPPPGGPR